MTRAAADPSLEERAGRPRHGRKLVPAEIARVVLVPASADSDACTSQTYVVDGGWV